ncbi:hypothetical protein BASA81_016395 [Batrachochytrium salamandrivorans]|nr:hypothetical protein BASA81_016395 [Batrachochytrium salamandrivorans]
MSVVLPNTPVGLLALALEALDDFVVGLQGPYAESSTVFCGTAVDLGDMFHLVAQDWSENPRQSLVVLCHNVDWYCMVHYLQESQLTAASQRQFSPRSATFPITHAYIY